MIKRIRKALEERDQGFSMIELLVVAILIGIFAAFAIPRYLQQKEKAVDAGLKSDLDHVALLAETYAIDNPSAASYGADNAAVTATFTALDFNRTGNNVVEIKGGPATGYCIRASNANSSTPAQFYHWDSENGGLKKTFAASSAGGACGGVATGFLTIG